VPSDQPEAFQSSPTPGSRCNADLLEIRASQPGFNPHRLLGAGATGRLYPVRHGPQRVSILTDSWEPVQRTSRWGSRRGSSGFNPHRLLGAGATAFSDRKEIKAMVVSILTDSWEPVQLSRRTDDAWEEMFQSSPTPGSRCNA